MNHSKTLKFDLGLYVTKCYREGEQDYLIVHREKDRHKPHSRIDLPVTPEIARFYEAHFKQYEPNPRVRIRLKSISEFVKEESTITS